MKKLLAFIVLGVGLCLTGCSDQQMVKQAGGTTTKLLPEGKKLVNITWKDNNLWLLMRDRKPGEPVDTYQFKESAEFGIMEGTVVLKEQ